MMFAVALLMIAVFAVSRYVTSSKARLVAAGGSAACQSFTQSVVDQVSSLGARDLVLPPFTDMTSMSGANQYGADANLQNFVGKLGGAAYLTQNILEPAAGNSVSVYNSHLILNSVNFLQALYNADNDYCDGGLVIPASLMPSITPQDLPGLETRFIIEPYRRSTGARIAGCPANLFSRPRTRPDQRYPNMRGDDDIGFHLRVEAQYDTQAGQKGCVSEQLFVHADDFALPAAPSIGPILTTDAGVTLTTATTTSPGGLPGAFLTSCDTDGVGFRNINMQFIWTRWESGTVFICREIDPNSGVGGDWMACNQSTLGGVTISSFSLSQQPGQIVVTAEFNDLPVDAQYGFQVAAVDTAGNISPPSNIANFFIDASRPGMGSIAEVTGNIGPPGDGNANRRATPVQSNWNRSEIQCNAESLAFYGTYSDILTHNFVDCTGSSDLSLSVSGQCYAFTGAPAHGLHSVTLNAADSCGDGTGSTYNWATSLTLMLVAPATHQRFDNDNNRNTDVYPYRTPLPTIPEPNNFVVSCDCNEPPLQDGDNECVAKTDLVPMGCYRQNTAPNVNFTYWDICGRGYKGFDASASYDVRGDHGDICGNIECRSGHTCCRYPEDCSVGYCYRQSDYPAPQDCSNKVVLPTPGDCPGYPFGLFSCNYQTMCGPSTTQCSNQGDTTGSPCTYDQIIPDACVANVPPNAPPLPVPGYTCTCDASAHGAESCVAGFCDQVNGGNCNSTYTFASTCGAMTPASGGCSPYDAGPVAGVVSNVVCPNRPARCNTVTTCTPSCPATNTYCSDQVVPDGCGDSCPAGTQTGCGCPDPATYCRSDIQTDSMGNQCPLGTKPGCGCAPYCGGSPPNDENGNACTYADPAAQFTAGCGCPDPSTYCASEVQYDMRGEQADFRCPTGTKDCGTTCANPADVCEGMPLGPPPCDQAGGTKCCETCPDPSFVCMGAGPIVCGVQCQGSILPRVCGGFVENCNGPNGCSGYCCNQGPGRMCLWIHCR